MEADLTLALKNSLLKPIHKHYIFYQLANALMYLHSAELVYGDLKPSNILVNEACEAKLYDFSLIQSVSKNSSLEAFSMADEAHSRWYMAP